MQSSSAKLLPSGTVSIALYGATIGKLGILDIAAATNQACANCVVDEELLDRRYLFYYLLHQRKHLVEAGQGGAQPNLTNKIVRDWPLPIAPRGEQDRIVAKIEELLRSVDAARDRLARVPKILKAFRQSVLDAACSGRLTEDWRSSNDCSGVNAVLDSIRARRLKAATTQAQTRRLEEVFDQIEDGDQDTLPSVWRYVRLGKLAERFDYGTSAKSNPSGDVPVLRMGNIQGGKIDWSDLVYTSDNAEISAYSLAPRSVLFNRTNSPELVGKTAIYHGERPAIFAGYLIRIVNVPELDPEYLNICLNAPAAREFCLQQKTDGVSQSNINAQKLALFELPFCSLLEQREIVRRVNQLLALATKIEKHVEGATKRAEKVTQSILGKAFRGDLVATEAELAGVEGRDYEPASVLLDRIKADRVKGGAQAPALRGRNVRTRVKA